MSAQRTCKPQRPSFRPTPVLLRAARSGSEPGANRAREQLICDWQRRAGAQTIVPDTSQTRVTIGVKAWRKRSFRHAFSQSDTLARHGSGPAAHFGCALQITGIDKRAGVQLLVNLATIIKQVGKSLVSLYIQQF